MEEVSHESFLLKAFIVYERLIVSMIEVLPILLAPFAYLCCIFVAKYSFMFFGWVFSVKRQNHPPTGRLEVLFFSLLGSFGAYLNYLSRDSLLENMVPSLVVLIVVSFQFYGLSKREGTVPFQNRSVLVSGIGAAVCFLISSRYINLIFDTHSQP